jgi:hypothetical protein
MKEACRIALTLLIIFSGAIAGFCIGAELCILAFKVRGITWNHSNVGAPPGLSSVWSLVQQRQNDCFVGKIQGCRRKIKTISGRQLAVNG